MDVSVVRGVIDGKRNCEEIDYVWRYRSPGGMFMWALVPQD